MKRVGLFGGSFNPIHNSHIEVANYILKKFALNKIIFIPAHISPLKRSVDYISKKHRLNMLNLALEHYKDFCISSYELNKGGISYTIDTVKYFKNKQPNTKYFFIMGEDSFESLPKWKSYKELINTIDLIVYPRQGFSFPSELKDLISPIVDQNNSNMSIFHSSKNTWIYKLNSPLLKIASRVIRLNMNLFWKHQIRHTDKDVKNSIPNSVFQYLKENKLYQSKALGN